MVHYANNGPRCRLKTKLLWKYPNESIGLRFSHNWIVLYAGVDRAYKGLQNSNEEQGFKQRSLPLSFSPFLSNSG